MTRESGQLLREYIEHGSERAFAEIVEHHLQIVYATALRRVGGNQELARDIAQIVFTDLASKARSLPAGVGLAGWLYRHTTYVASNTLRGEIRRERREKEAALMQSIEQEYEHAAWLDALPLLDDFLASLGAADRDAIILRFLQGQDLRTVGRALGTSEDAAHKRVSRALERLRILFQKRGVSISAGTIAAGLVGQGATPAPAAATAVASAALASVVPVTSVATMTPILIMTKLKTLVAYVALTAAVSVPYVLQQQTVSKLRAENAALKSAVAQEVTTSVARPTVTNGNAAPQEIELARLRAEITRLRQETQQLARAAVRAPAPAQITSQAPPRGRQAMREYIPSDTWRDAGLGSPEAALQTIG